MLRVASAVLAYGSQVLLARWMGSFEFGIYVYVWTWVLLIGQSLDLGLGTAAQRFIPEYRESGALDLLRGFLFGSRLLAFGIATVVALACAGGVWLLAPWLNDYLVVPLYLACISLPAYGLAKPGRHRAQPRLGLSLMPTYVVRQLLLTALMAGAYLAGLPMTAVTAMIVAAVSIWLPTIGQLLVLNRRLAVLIAPGPKAHAIRYWLVTSAPILLAEGFYLLLTYADILVLQQFRPPDEVAVYYAAAKTLALVSFIHYSMSATTAHRFSAYHVAGDRAGLAAFIAQSIKWTFWPSLAATALLLAVGRPLATPVRRAIRRRLSPDVHPGGRPPGARRDRADRTAAQHAGRAAHLRALIYGAAFAINFGACLALIPLFGAAGAATATATALIVESIMLFWVTKRRLGFHVFIWGRAELAVKSRARHDRSVFRVEWRPLGVIRTSVGDCHRMAVARRPRARAQRVSRARLRARGAPVFGRDVGAGLVWSRPSPSRLMGFFPARIERRRYGIALPVLVGWTHPYAPLGTPLVDRDAGEAVMSAWLDHLASRPDLPHVLLLPYLPVDGPLAGAFAAALRGATENAFRFPATNGALLAPAGARALFDHAIGPRSARELRRQEKRLAEAGTLGSSTVREPAGMAAALGDFLALEAAGWKGRAGTAARTHDDIRAFMENAVTGLARDGKARIDRPVCRRPADRRHRDAAERRDRVVLEDRL